MRECSSRSTGSTSGWRARAGGRAGSRWRRAPFSPACRMWQSRQEAENEGLRGESSILNLEIGGEHEAGDGHSPGVLAAECVRGVGRSRRAEAGGGFRAEVLRLVCTDRAQASEGGQLQRGDRQARGALRYAVAEGAQ